MDYVDIDRTKTQLEHAIDVADTIQGEASEATSQDGGAIAIGGLSEAIGDSTTAVGNVAKAQGNYSVAIGNGSEAHNVSAIAIGHIAKTSGLSPRQNQIAIGEQALASNTNAIAIGTQAICDGENAVQLQAGTNNQANTMKFKGTTIVNSDGKIPIDSTDIVKNNASIVIGEGASGGNPRAIAIGNNTDSDFNDCIAIGTNAKASGAQNIQSTTIAVGKDALAMSENSIAIGNGAECDTTPTETRSNTIAIGTGASTKGARAIAIGRNAGNSLAGVTGTDGSISIGDNSGAYASSIAIGVNARCGANGAIQLGEGYNNTSNTLQFKDITIIKANGKIPSSIIEGGGGGSDLPDVTSADNGDVLTVVDGEWDKATPITSYNQLETNSLPSINGTKLTGNKTASQLGLQDKAGLMLSLEGTTEQSPAYARNAMTKNIIHTVDSGGYMAFSTTTVNDTLAYIPEGATVIWTDDYYTIIGANYSYIVNCPISDLANFGNYVMLTEQDFINKLATTTGNSNTKAISQKAATDAINNIKPARWLFVDTLPTTDIDTRAVYLTPNSRIFPSVVNDVSGDWGKGAVTYDELTGYKFIRLKTTSDILYNDSRNKSAEYEIYTTDGVVWTKTDESDEGGDNEWATKMGWTTATTTTGSTSGYQNIAWSNCTFCYNQNTYKHYNPDNNTAYITGLLIDVSQLNPFIKMMSTYDGSAWTDIGVCDFTKLFDGVKMQASKVTVTDGTTYTMVDNTEYYGDNLLEPVFNSPTGDYECYFLLTFASSGTVGGAGDIFPDITRVVGDVPVFDNGETWEISIKNGIFVAGKVE